MTTLRKSALAVATVILVGGLAINQAAFAEDASSASATEPSPLTANVTVVNDYRYRGISQSNFQPAIQGGFDYAHPSGFYIGNWNSSISWISDANKGTSAPVEMDFYAGFKHDWSSGFIADIGVLQYYYPMSGYPSGLTNPNSTEIYAAQNFTFDSFTGYLKFSYAATTLFGTANSSGSNYTDFTLNYDTGFWGLALNGHVGYQYVAGSQMGVSNSSLFSYTDWKLGVTKDFGSGLSANVSYVGTNANKYGYMSPNGTNLGKDGFLISLTKTF